MIKEKMSLKEFREKYMGKSSKWDFNKFSIVCNKCNSKTVEFNGYLESERGYYDDGPTLSGAIIVKCHVCGNAFRIHVDYSILELNNDGEKAVDSCIKCGDRISYGGYNGMCNVCSKKQGEIKWD